jgi:hypothetical protein
VLLGVLVVALGVVDILVLFELGAVVDVVGDSVFCGVAGLLAVDGAETLFCVVVEGGVVSMCLGFIDSCHMPNPPPVTITIARITSGFLPKESIFVTQLVCSSSDPPDTAPIADGSKGCFGWLGSIFYSFYAVIRTLVFLEHIFHVCVIYL